MSQSYKSLLEKSHLIQASAVSDAKLFIEQGIWSDLTIGSLNSWIDNFKGEDEVLLSAFLLNSFIYRSNAQTTALLKSAITTVLPSAIQVDTWKALEVDDLLNNLTKKYNIDNNLKIVPVIRDIDNPTKSGPLLARLYRRNININTNYFIWHWQIGEAINSGTEVIIFIDDIIASGNQFSIFINNCNLEDYDARFIYIPLLGCEKGINRIIEDYSKLEVHSVESMSADTNFFGMNSDYTDLKDLYLSVEKRKLKSGFLNQFSLGYEKLALTVSYSHSTPNATLPLYWYESENFSPLVRR